MWLHLLVSILSLATISAFAAVPDSFTQKNINYRTYVGECPGKSSSNFAMIVMKEFEKKHSLKDVKEKILNEKLDEKHFLSDYRINYNPVIKTLRINLECPQPLVKVQVYKSNGEEHYSAILGDNGKMYDPGYENLMKAEKKLMGNLPLLAISMKQLEGDAPTNLVQFIKLMDKDLRNQISEIIINKNNELTIVFALGGKATSVFMGADLWEEKLTRLTKIVGYVQKNKRYPGSINLVNSKKVVVKFSDKI
ncbi:MAG: cell division protein FtsQ [Bdellovibrionales bacterium]|nr:cell division protein FtsQ [Bdellovibrionales bacterium]